jgi:hypothetical protein
MHLPRALAFTASLVAIGCSVDTEPPPVVGDVGDTSESALKVACQVSRSTLLANAAGGRRTAIERGFSWYDAQVPYSQTSQYQGYRTDCSGFVSMCWQLGTSKTTADFINDTSQWSSLDSFAQLQPADAMVYRSGGAGHIMMFLGWNDAAKSQACVLEQASTAEDMQFRARTISSLVSGGYHAIKATKLAGQSGGGTDNSQCYCDAECTQYGDCCSSCSTGTGGSSGSGGASGAGGGGDGQCYCDAECTQYGDCCSSCSTGTGGSSGSGGASGAGGGGGDGQCYCDADCAQYGDCCASCPNGSGGAGGEGQCYCDAMCYYYGDCCSYC